jgi:hypothetical protein
MQEHQENYNDYKVSAPEGMVGDGFSNVGRNYSPAWGGQFQTGGYLKKVKKTEKDLLKKYVNPAQARALTRAKQQGINTGIHNGPLDAIRHSSSAAAMSSALPTWTNFIPGVAPLKIAATNIAGAAHELNAPNDWKEHASDLYNNFIGSVVGVLPVSEKNKHDLLIQAQKHGVLSDMGDKTPLRKRPAAPQLPQLKLPPLQMGGSVYPVNYVPEAQNGKLTFLQPTSEKLPEGYRIPYADPSSELAMSIGGENGEPAYLIPSFKYGKPLYNPIEEFKKTGEHLGGPFKTWQEADKWEQEVRHPYVEKGQDIPMPIKTWGEMAMGGSIPGAVGFTYARTKGIPSNGPYAKKTKASAQNGQEMQYYREGLDWKPKTISQNGGWLDAYGDNVYKAQTGKNIRVKNADGTISVMNTDSPEYREMYQSGMVQHPSAGQGDNPYFGGILDEVSITRAPREKGFWEQYADKIAEENRDAGLLGAIIGTPISAVTSLPQLAATYALTDKMQRPSEALDVQNPYGAFAVDLFTDPINYVGAGLADDALKLTSKGKNLLKKGFGKPVKVAEQNIVPIKDMFIQPTPLKASETLPKELEPYLSSYVKPISDEEEVFRMSMGPEYKAKKLAEDTVYLDPEGNIISSPKKTYTPFIEDEDIKYINAKKNKNINVVPEERSMIRRSSIIDINDMKQGGVIKDDMGQWNHPGEITEINSPYITMKGVPYDVLGISDTGDTKLMKPGKNYKFKGKKVTEFPMAKNGLRQEQKGLVNLDNLTNFTNYNKPQPGGWLSKYE